MFVKYYNILYKSNNNGNNKNKINNNNDNKILYLLKKIEKACQRTV